MSDEKLILDGESLSLNTLAGWEAQPRPVTLSEGAKKRMQTSVDAVARVIDEERVSYGINTGFGALARERISRDKVVQLQYNLVRSHACGVGDALSPALTRRLMLLKANALAVGCSGIRAEVVETLLALLNADVLPMIPEQGSVGASGDLAPLAHLALALIGEGEALHDGEVLEGRDVLAAVDREPVVLQAKEGLALLNGTQLSATLAIDGLFRLEQLWRASIAAGALSVEALAGSYSPFDARVHQVRRMPGQIRAAEGLRAWLTESEIRENHRDCTRVQDPYALRCMPQVLGAVRDTLDHARNMLEHELNGVSDNPLIFDDEIISGGNFHAEPIAMISDFLAIAGAEMGSISERRTDCLVRGVNPALPLFLTEEAGVESGFMIAHVTAAALASENKTLAHPASVDSISTSAGQEDHVSMAPWAGLKLHRLCDNLARILAVELMAASRGVELQAPLKTTAELQQLLSWIRDTVPAHKGDRRLDGDIEALAEALREPLPAV
ncbi:histidine ammonia-lyase [Natronospira bacteriovora]|uniref:Histidine ammonia-lyase n=1 Tax=Natronospira bacteriovora TaxID=3069753 RepID=A0ABU0W478_9GAMM|nr:histidine ammonia-lyase [Natronospira sp. AB-CW4]MDQ2068563.1 histidine ammonia-lyase [Natronospira sp. AB-CW4]